MCLEKKNSHEGVQLESAPQHHAQSKYVKYTSVAKAASMLCRSELVCRRSWLWAVCSAASKSLWERRGYYSMLKWIQANMQIYLLSAQYIFVSASEIMFCSGKMYSPKYLSCASNLFSNSVLKISHCSFMNVAQISLHAFETCHGVGGQSRNALQTWTLFICYHCCTEIIVYHCKWVVSVLSSLNG